jgi:hypothetical protein
VDLPYCDARDIWFWADRYPSHCLEAVSKIFENDAVWRRQLWLRSLYLLSLVFGVLAYWVTCLGFEWLVRTYERRRRRAVTVRREDGGIRAPLLPPSAVLAIVLILTILVNPAVAYPCPSYYPPYDRRFANANGTVFGVIHGWLSDCFDETYECGKSCTTSPSGGEVTCTPISCTRSKPYMLPMDFVDRAAWRVKKCGFRFVDAVPGVVDRRIPKPSIEEKLWVKIAVNKFNSTDGGEEKWDDGVRCLYEII